MAALESMMRGYRVVEDLDKSGEEGAGMNRLGSDQGSEEEASEFIHIQC